MKTKKFYIRGMHCVSCEKLLDDEFCRIPGVKNVRVDRLKNTGEVDYDGAEPDFSEIKKIAEKFGYEAYESPDSLGRPESKGSPDAAQWTDWIKAVLIVVVILFLFRFFQSTGIIDAINIQSSKMTYGVAFLVGLVASVSSCLAVVGAVIIAFGEKYRSAGKGFYANAVKPNLFFHIGRLAAFFILGGLLGLIGGELNISGNFISIFTIIIAIVMGWLGLNILGIVPSISNSGVRMPKRLTKNWSDLKNSEHKAAPFLLGGLSFFLPCGFTQSMQIFALASGSFWVGGLTLFVFALGTVPSLLLLGITASWTKNSRMVVFQKVAGLLVVLFAVFTLQSGLALLGVSTDVLSADDANKSEQESAGAQDIGSKGEPQIVEMRVLSSGFSPATLRVKKGVPVRWVVKGDQLSGCTNKIIVPSLDISKPLQPGDNVIEFTPTNSGAIPFSCGMGMVQGKFIVE
ncbi:MAG: sulfite exporter TauE/SafE family protein [Candidatus Moranbacteria bacterium]|nr:sulfite exporter TauE/SafE family protein [Candidatus Moranbacteria bacterium]